ncbi:MAG: hypothetical protein U1F57_06480 [bacterium]
MITYVGGAVTGSRGLPSLQTVPLDLKVQVTEQQPAAVLAAPSSHCSVPPTVPLPQPAGG